MMRFFLLFVGLFGATFSCFADYGIALGYKPKYQPGFTHFDYVNPEAPKRGEITLPNAGSFNSLNPYLLKGDPALGVGLLVVESLMTSSSDEPFSQYGLLADDVQIAPNGLAVTFHLNQKARFHNGDPVLAKDVAFSFNTLTKNEAINPLYRFYWADVSQVVIVDPYTVRFEFKKQNAELHLILGQLPIFSHKSFPNGVENSTQMAPIGSGPYTVGKVNWGKSIEFRQNSTYWGNNLPSRKGMYNFNIVHFKSYLDDTARLEAFKAGDYDVSTENIARNWARGYQGTKFDDGLILKQNFPTENGSGMQGFVLNLRNPILKDKALRKALNLSFDFEWVNRQLFYKQYQRSYSYFNNSELSARGFASEEEKQLLRPLAKGLPREIFNPPPSPARSDLKLGIRPNLLEARKILLDAGYRYQKGKLLTPKGQQINLEFVSYSNVYERIVSKWQKDLTKIGINLTVRVVDPAIYQQRLNRFDYDITVVVYGASQSPGNEQLNFHSCEAAKTEGSNNWAGYCNPELDKLLNHFIHFDSRAELVTASRALDRVLLNEYLVIPNWYTADTRIAWWNRFEYPKTLPKFYYGTTWVMETWWAK